MHGLWDKFKVINKTPESDSTTSEKPWIEFGIRFLKVIFFLLTFTVVLCGTVVNKLTILLMTSQIRPFKIVRYCNENENENMDETKNYLAEISTTEQVRMSIDYVYTLLWGQGYKNLKHIFHA